MNALRICDHPAVVYLTAVLRTRIARARAAEDRGASAIELAIITAILAVIAITAGTIIYNKVKSAAGNVQTDFRPGG